MELFYSKNISGKIITLDQEESRHAAKALRLRIGDNIHVTDGEGRLFNAVIENDDPREVTASIIDQKEIEAAKFRIHIAIAPTKNIDRLEWFLEKATEIGIDTITPMVCKHSERTVIKPERLEKILVSAMKQSNQFHLPKLNELRPFKEVVTGAQEQFRFIAHCYEEDKRNLTSYSLNGEDALVIIGPEGDFTKEEIELALGNNFRPVSLGSTRLRTETAGLVALQTIHFLNEVKGKD